MTRSALKSELAKQAFLDAIQQHGHIVAACESAGVSRHAAWLWRKDPEFKAEFEVAMSIAVENIESSVFQRAMESDTLAMFVLRGRKPEVYRDKLAVDQSLTLANNGVIDARPDPAMFLAEWSDTPQRRLDYASKLSKPD